MSGRPIRFLGGVIGLWTLGRIAFLLPVGTAPASVAKVLKSPRPKLSVAPLAAPITMRGIAMPSPPAAMASPPIAPKSVPLARAPLQPVSTANPPDASPSLPFWPDPLLALPDPPIAPARWSGSAWAILRQGSSALLPGGQLGGTQAGIRILRRIDRDGRLSASLRLSAPLEGVGREMAVGIDWRPSARLAIRLLVEQRIALDEGQGGPAVLAVSGFGPRSVAPGISLTGYAQAGAVGRTAIEPFADGAMRATTALAQDVDLGLGLWGGAQRGAQRLDIGPTLGIALPVAGRRLRLSLDWRQRVAGQAAPGSGPALSIGGDF
ncbi:MULTISPECIES: hypothetical protein [Sphingomonas]|uniref:Uncharacterized protein n=1 Tax=Sphingomonas paucimobilis TaxID=13689 RepID=A0A7Y2KPQ3_SPHPI|nr:MULTISPECIES: hypothetical protein [Sphingomonas]MCM3680527.1 hypothetical protein [Sphingomonas paucimobilis]MDG5970057.1 hypothetical protein [Sphingomonas paucimobilis]NNG57300.1 hypothetical protein [Sphingomonas paucimobilis]SUJ33002.1 Uncharacterised protein [Sphingomonas paucimobilis]